jgi:hypothetical protein
MTERSYALERLYEDQSPELVTDTIPAVLAWLAPSGASEPPAISFQVRSTPAAALVAEEVRLLFAWNMGALEAHDPGVRARVERMRTRKTADREHVTELAAYGLALVGISLWMPGRRALAFREYAPPDILLDATDGAVRGVEVAGRSSGGFGALRIVLEGRRAKGGKRAELMNRPDIVEAHVSLWCARPRVSVMLQVKP